MTQMHTRKYVHLDMHVDWHAPFLLVFHTAFSVQWSMVLLVLQFDSPGATHVLYCQLLSQAAVHSLWQVAMLPVWVWGWQTEKGIRLYSTLLRISLSLSVSLFHTYWEAAAVTDTLRTKTCNQELQHRCCHCCFSERLCFMLIALGE